MLAEIDQSAGLREVETSALTLSAYQEYVDPALWSRITSYAASLRGLRVVHINSTPDGGGVAEILSSLVPLLQSVGLDAHWCVLRPDDGFFGVTKRMHNWLQGHPGRMTARHVQTYSGYLKQLAGEMQHLHADIWVVHDPQPLPLHSLVPLQGAALWRCHIDCSTPNKRVSAYLLPWVQRYHRSIFSMPEYALPGLSPGHAEVVYPAIDPLTAKNRCLPPDEARAILGDLGLDPQRPLATQVSRFDPWKDPWQAVDAYRLAKREIPELQLALVGVFSAKDDPEGPKIYRAIRRYANGDPDVHLFTDARQVRQREVNAFQSASTVILQRSRREGFGLTVTEAMWKGRPVIATPVGGIKVQIQDGENGCLTTTAEGCAERIVQFVRNPHLADAIGQAARASVRQRFLLPRLLCDDLALYSALTASQAAA